MQDISWRETAERASEAITDVPVLSQDGALKLLARATVKKQIAEEIHRMQAEGKAFTLTEEEERMLLSFRRFKAALRKDGHVFRWQTRRSEGVIEAPEQFLIHDPQEVA